MKCCVITLCRTCFWLRFILINKVVFMFHDVSCIFFIEDVMKECSTLMLEVYKLVLNKNDLGSKENRLDQELERKLTLGGHQKIDALYFFKGPTNFYKGRRILYPCSVTFFHQIFYKSWHLIHKLMSYTFHEQVLTQSCNKHSSRWNTNIDLILLRNVSVDTWNDLMIFFFHLSYTKMFLFHSYTNITCAFNYVLSKQIENFQVKCCVVVP